MNASISRNKTRQTIRQSGKTVHIAMPIGSFPIRYQSNSTMAGQAPVSAEKNLGNRWVADDHLCQRWYRWRDAKQYRFKLQRVGATVYWPRNDGLSGSATIREPATTLRPTSPGGVASRS